MIRKRNARALAGGLSVVLLLVVASTAYAFVTGTFRGKTGQGRSIKFHVAKGKVTHLQFHIEDKCPNGHLYAVHDFGFPSIKINKFHKFDATFAAKHGPKAQVEIIGTVSPTQVKGKLIELRHINKEDADCAGRTKYTVHKQ